MYDYKFISKITSFLYANLDHFICFYRMASQLQYGQEPTDIMHHKNQMIKDLKSIDSLIMNMKNSFTFISDYISSCYQLNYYDTPKYITYLAMFHW